MARTWLVIDGNYLCYRAFFAMGGLEFDTVRTGVVYGFLRDILTLTKEHNTSDLVFCFDHGKSKRRAIYPGYKRKREEAFEKLTGEEKHDREELRRQVNALKTDYLPSIGYQNVFYHEGYEADDVIASVVDGTRQTDQCILVSADKDMYQLLSPRTCVWLPSAKRAVTAESFTDEWGVTPQQWAKVKAIAGCSTDDVEGVDGVGEKTAAKYVAGTLPVHHATYRRIKDARTFWQTNYKLVSLPFDGCPDFAPVSDRIDVRNWNNLTKRLGMPSLEDMGRTVARAGR